VKRDAYLRKLASMIAIDERSLNDELQRVLRGQRPAGVTASFSAPLRQGDKANSVGMKTGDEETESEVTDSEVGGEGTGEEETAKNSRKQEPVRTFGLDRSGKSRLQWEDYLIGLLLQNPGLSTHVCGIINDGDFAGTDTRELYHIFNSVYQRDSSPLFQSFEEFVPAALLATVDRARKCVESGSPLEGAGLVKAAVQCATRLKRARLLQLNTDVKYLMDEAKKTGDVAGEQQFRRQLVGIHQQLRTIDSAMHLQG